MGRQDRLEMVRRETSETVRPQSEPGAVRGLNSQLCCLGAPDVLDPKTATPGRARTLSRRRDVD